MTTSLKRDKTAAPDCEDRQSYQLLRHLSKSLKGYEELASLMNLSYAKFNRRAARLHRDIEQWAIKISMDGRCFMRLRTGVNLTEALREWRIRNR